MKKLFLVLALLASCSLGATTVVLDDGPEGAASALAILDFEFQGQTYNIQFLRQTFRSLEPSGAFPFIGDGASAAAASAEIRDILNATYVGRFRVTRVGEDDPCCNRDLEFLIPSSDSYAGSSDGFVAAVSHSRSGDHCCEWRPDTGPGAHIRGQLGNYTFAVFTAVPVPASVWLFASGLGLLGWMRRKKDSSCLGLH